ncbi:MAG: PEPxxWA-CTERM sorting domain-containing protein [Proteobacteria bacterium]|nr:PEPxxWA-CTERM sorting domain-containing protein [Pseudomonadota bacterium]
MAGLTATLTSYYSAANALWGGTQLQTAVFTGPGTGGGGNALGTVTGPWSETVKYSLNFTGGNGSNFNGTANLTAVPEPATWGLMLLGFGAMGGMLRTRRRAPRVRFA